MSEGYINHDYTEGFAPQEIYSEGIPLLNINVHDYLVCERIPELPKSKNKNVQNWGVWGTKSQRSLWHILPANLKITSTITGNKSLIKKMDCGTSWGLWCLYSTI